MNLAEQETRSTGPILNLEPSVGWRGGGGGGGGRWREIFILSSHEGHNGGLTLMIKPTVDGKIYPYLTLSLIVKYDAS